MQYSFHLQPMLFPRINCLSLGRVDAVGTKIKYPNMRMFLAGLMCQDTIHPWVKHSFGHWLNSVPWALPSPEGPLTTGHEACIERELCLGSVIVSSLQMRIPWHWLIHDALIKKQHGTHPSTRKYLRVYNWQTRHDVTHLAALSAQTPLTETIWNSNLVITTYASPPHPPLQPISDRSCPSGD